MCHAPRRDHFSPRAGLRKGHGVSGFRLEGSWDVVSCPWSVVSGQWSAGAAGIRSGCVGAGLGVLNPVFRLDSWKPTFCSWKPASGCRRWLPMAAGCRVSTKKAAPPTGRGDKKRESPRLALRRATPSCANLACTGGIVQGREESVEAQGMTRNTMRQALHGLCGTWGCHSPRQSGFGTGAGLESHVLYQVAKRVESKGVSRAAIRACCGCQSVAAPP